MKDRVVLTVIIVGSIAALASIAGLVIIGIRRARDASLRQSTHDAVQVISRGVAAEIRAGRSPSWTEIEGNIRKLIDAGVINASFDRDGQPADVYGTPFRVSLSGSLLTASSAGPDRIFGTDDDIEVATSTKP
jgi:hypothetical protein